MTMLERAAETASELGISVQEALALEFIAAAALAEIAGNRRAQVIMLLGAQHVVGTIDADTMRRGIAALDRGTSRKR